MVHEYTCLQLFDKYFWFYSLNLQTDLSWYTNGRWPISEHKISIIVFHIFRASCIRFHRNINQHGNYFHLAIILRWGLVSILLQLPEELELFSTGLSLPFSFEGFLISVEAPRWVLVSRLYLESLASCSLLPLWVFKDSDFEGDSNYATLEIRNLNL